MNDRLAPISYAFKNCLLCFGAVLQNSTHYAPIMLNIMLNIFLSPILTSLLILLVYEHLLVPLEYKIPCTKELFTK